MKSEPIVVMTGEQLRALVLDAVTSALANAAPADASDVLDCDEVATLIGVHPRTVPRLVAKDGLPTLRRIGKLWRFSRRAVLAWMETRAPKK